MIHYAIFDYLPDKKEPHSKKTESVSFLSLPIDRMSLRANLEEYLNGISYRMLILGQVIYTPDGKKGPVNVLRTTKLAHFTEINGKFFRTNSTILPMQLKVLTIR
jgi:hypothetical protein